MTGRKADTRESDTRTSRRHFFTLLAGSPLLAMAYPTLPPSWQQAVGREWQRGAAAQGAGALEAQLAGQLIESADDAINVWDFERVAHANNLPEHWNYIHMGVDDFETRKANREGFQRLVLRPRRLGPDVTKLDTSVQLFGRRWNTPLFLC